MSIHPAPARRAPGPAAGLGSGCKSKEQLLCLTFQCLPGGAARRLLSQDPAPEPRLWVNSRELRGVFIRRRINVAFRGLSGPFGSCSVPPPRRGPGQRAGLGPRGSGLVAPGCGRHAGSWGGRRPARRMMEKGKVSGMAWGGVGERDLVAAFPRGNWSCLPFNRKSRLEAAGGSVEGWEEENG